MKNLQNVFVVLSVRHISTKEKQLQVLISKESGQLPTVGNIGQDESLIKVLMNLQLNATSFNFVGSDVTKQYGLTFTYALLPSQKALQKHLVKLDEYDFINVSGVSSKVREKVDSAINMVGERKGVSFVETIIKILPSPFTKMDCEYTAVLFLPDDMKHKTHIFFRYLKEQINPTERSFFKPTLKIKEVGVENEVIKKTGKAAMSYEIVE